MPGRSGEGKERETFFQVFFLFCLGREGRLYLWHLAFISYNCLHVMHYVRVISVKTSVHVRVIRSRPA